MAPRILKPQHEVEVSGKLHVPADLPPGKDHRYPLDRKVGGPQSLCGCGGNNLNKSLYSL
jgi:hypothetical protein